MKFLLVSCCLRGLGVGVVVDYANMTMTTQTLSENFKGFSQILKEQSGEKRYLGGFKNPITIIYKHEKTPFPTEKNACSHSRFLCGRVIF